MNTFRSIRPDKRKRLETMIAFEKRLQLLLLATAIMLLQLCFAILMARNHDSISFAFKYQSLWQHDSQWYGHIMDWGYVVKRLPLETPGNKMAHVGFFPGYPIASYALSSIARLPTRIAMLVTSQIFTIGMWTYFILLLRKLRIRPLHQVVAILFVTLFPSAFYLVAAYSESMFMCMLLGFLYWMTSDKKYGWVLASIHGFVMSSTRIVGVPLMVVPIIWMVLQNNFSFKLNKKMIVVSFSTVVSAVVFFLYCQANFGIWNLYSQAQAIGWKVLPNYSAIFDVSIYLLKFPAISWDGFVNSDDVSRLSVPIVLAVFLSILVSEILMRSNRENVFHRNFRILCYTSCFFLLLITISGLWSRKMISVIRYMLPVVMLLSLCVASLCSQCKPLKSKIANRVLIAILAIILGLFFYVQAGFIDLFSYGVWIA